MEDFSLKVTSPTVSEIFDKMSYGPAPESPEVVYQWLKQHKQCFGHFIDNKWFQGTVDQKRYDCVCPSDGKVLASTLQGTDADVNMAVKAAQSASPSWAALSGHQRARHIYSIARHIQKHSRLFAVLEALENGKSVRETRDADIPTVVRHLYYYAGWATLSDDEHQLGAWGPLGVVAAIVPWNFPLMLLIWKVAPALAMGNTVVLKPATYTRLSALLFAEICAEAGLPAGVFNVLTGGGRMGQTLAEHDGVDKVGFTGSTEIGKVLRKAIAGTGKKISLELGGKSPVIVYESADLDSAVEAVVDAIWFNQGQVCSAGSKLLVEESIFTYFIDKLKLRMKSFRIGHSLDKSIDMAALVSQSHKATVDSLVQQAIQEGAEVFQWPEDLSCFGNSSCYYPLTLVTNVSTSSTIVMEEVFGPVLVALPFRTAKEAITMANNSIYGLGASVHSERMTLALETAKQLKAGSVWINCHNLFDAAAGFGGYKQSGFGRDGGKEGLYEYLKPSWQNKTNKSICKILEGVDSFGADYHADGPNITMDRNTNKVDRTYKLYIGGLQKRPDANYSRVVFKGGLGGTKAIANVGEANRKDVRNAVEAARKAQPAWELRSGFNRSQILYYVAENLALRQAEFAQSISQACDVTDEDSALKELDTCVTRLFYWAAMADKYGGTVQETQLYGTVIKIHEAMGVVAIVCPSNSERPLLCYVSLVAAALARGNAVIVVPPQARPVPALDLCQVFETSDLPGGVLNVLSGSSDHLTKYLAEHQNIDSIWYFGSSIGSKFVETASAENLKRSWVNYGNDERNWMDDKQGQGEEFLYQAVQVKNVWLTMGEIFAN